MVQIWWVRNLQKFPNTIEHVAAHESTEDLNREGLVISCLGMPTTFRFARSKGKQTPDKILLPLFVIVSRSYV